MFGIPACAGMTVVVRGASKEDPIYDIKKNVSLMKKNPCNPEIRIICDQKCFDNYKTKNCLLVTDY
jgi:hypothetical protein